LPRSSATSRATWPRSRVRPPPTKSSPPGPGRWPLGWHVPTPARPAAERVVVHVPERLEVEPPCGRVEDLVRRRPGGTTSPCFLALRCARDDHLVGPAARRGGRLAVLNGLSHTRPLAPSYCSRPRFLTSRRGDGPHASQQGCAFAYAPRDRHSPDGKFATAARDTTVLQYWRPGQTGGPIELNSRVARLMT
jgi:hypothetical protein